jgi:hypothetical protein
MKSTLLVSTLAAAPLCVAAQIDAGTLEQVAGRYAVHCAKTDMQLKVTANALEVTNGGRRLRATKPQASASFFGPSPPNGFVTALQGQVAGGQELLFFVYRDGQGRARIQLDGSAKVRQQLGPALLAQRFRLCRSSKSPS